MLYVPHFQALRSNFAEKKNEAICQARRWWACEEGNLTDADLETHGDFPLEQGARRGPKSTFQFGDPNFQVPPFALVPQRDHLQGRVKPPNGLVLSLAQPAPKGDDAGIIYRSHVVKTGRRSMMPTLSPGIAKSFFYEIE